MAQSTEILPNGLQLLQDDRFFKLGQDSVLLSAFAKPRRNAKLLDLGCGTGALALLVWRPDLKITGLELQDGPLDLFRQSIIANELENVTALQGDLRQMRNADNLVAFSDHIHFFRYHLRGPSADSGIDLIKDQRTDGIVFGKYRFHCEHDPRKFPTGSNF